MARESSVLAENLLHPTRRDAVGLHHLSADRNLQTSHAGGNFAAIIFEEGLNQPKASLLRSSRRNDATAQPTLPPFLRLGEHLLRLFLRRSPLLHHEDAH